MATPQHQLEVRNVSKRFGGVAALSEVSLEVQLGEIHGLIGPNGAGKTTLFNVITGVYRPDGGAVIFRDQDVSRLQPFQRCRLGIARTFQITRPFLGLTVRENVTVGAYFGQTGGATLSVAEGEADEALELVGLGGRRHAPAGTLTLGERKKLEFARALSTKPEVLLLDEVMGGLSAGEVPDVMKAIEQIRATGVTVLMIEHVMRAVMGISDRITVLHYGQILARGTPSEIVANDLVIAAYLGGAVHADA